jgi:hypothetical protein
MNIHMIVHIEQPLFYYEDSGRKKGTWATSSSLSVAGSQRATISHSGSA